MGPTARAVVTAAAQECKRGERSDLRRRNPFDFTTIGKSVTKTGRLVVAHEAPTFLGLGSEIAARITERCFFNLEAPVIRVGGYHTPYPGSRMEEHYLPDLDRIFDGVDRALSY